MHTSMYLFGCDDHIILRYCREPLISADSRDQKDVFQPHFMKHPIRRVKDVPRPYHALLTRRGTEGSSRTNARQKMMVIQCTYEKLFV